MLTAFITASIFVGLMSSICWSGSGVVNVLVKIVMIAYTIFAVIMLFAHLAPLINSGALRLV